MISAPVSTVLIWDPVDVLIHDQNALAPTGSGEICFESRNESLVPLTLIARLPEVRQIISTIVSRHLFHDWIAYYKLDGLFVRSYFSKNGTAKEHCDLIKNEFPTAKRIIYITSVARNLDALCSLAGPEKRFESPWQEKKLLTLAFCPHECRCQFRDAQAIQRLAGYFQRGADLIVQNTAEVYEIVQSLLAKP
ncbi:MAG: hypothetical protein WC449_01705 [Candidatus Paceibacterota bacterium]